MKLTNQFMLKLNFDGISTSSRLMQAKHATSGARKKFSRGAKVSSRSFDVTNQLYRECQRNGHSRVVRGHAPEKFCKITPKKRIFVHSRSKF